MIGEGTVLPLELSPTKAGDRGRQIQIQILLNEWVRKRLPDRQRPHGPLALGDEQPKKAVVAPELDFEGLGRWEKEGVLSSSETQR